MATVYDATTIPTVIGDFLRYGEVNLGHSQKTINEYFLDLRMFFRFILQERGVAPTDVPFEELPISAVDLDLVRSITKSDINFYVDYLRKARTGHKHGQDTQGLSEATTKRKVATLRAFFRYLCSDRELIERNPAERIIVPRVRKRVPEYLGVNESLRLLEAVEGLNQERDYCILFLFLNCGLRVSELVGINLSDLRFEDGNPFLKIQGKGNKERQVYLSQPCVDAIESYMLIREKAYAPAKGQENALFLSRKHHRLSVDAVQSMVRTAMLKAGLQPLSPHKLRHTAATLMYANGVDVRTLQELLGHENLSTTEIYTHINNGDLVTAARANPINKAAGHKKKAR